MNKLTRIYTDNESISTFFLSFPGKCKNKKKVINLHYFYNSKIKETTYILAIDKLKESGNSFFFKKII